MSQEETIKVPDGYLRLVSGDGFSFTVLEEYASVSGLISAMMKSPFKESQTRIINLPEIRGVVLEMICQYMYYIPRYNSQLEMSNDNRSSRNLQPINLDSFIEIVSQSREMVQDLVFEVYISAMYLDL